MLTALALAAIRFYQRVLSPRKGFCCAYRSCTGGASCSALGYRAIRWRGVWDGLGILRLRLRACSAVYARSRRTPRRWQSQAGECDCPAGGCDMPGVDGAGHTCECLSGLGDCLQLRPCARPGPPCACRLPRWLGGEDGRQDEPLGYPPLRRRMP